MPILHYFWDIARYWSKIADFSLRLLHLAPQLGVIPLEIRQDIWRQNAVPCVCAVSTLHRVVTDGRTDRHRLTVETRKATAYYRAARDENYYRSLTSVKRRIFKTHVVVERY